ncbi:hypothetical protein [Nocardia crassostreae]|nr:hypothetical protein [Nocardia crassostreae]
MLATPTHPAHFTGCACSALAAIARSPDRPDPLAIVATLVKPDGGYR